MADPGKLEQILHNLVGNSAKFTDEGYISVDVELVDDHVSIVIEDTGKGLSKDNLEGILDSFEGDLVQSTGLGHNTGLGLKISNRLIELHGGKLLMESAEGFGSYFSFNLLVTLEDAPINEEFDNYTIGVRTHSQGITKIRPHRNARIGKKFRIMVVDDEIINVKVLIAQLNRVGYEVITYYNGQSALQALKEGNLPDLILLDIMMPNMNGFEVCQEIRNEYSQIELPIIMLTAKNHTTDILEAFKAGANDYIAKPIAKDELLARIKTHVELSKINHAFSRFVPHEFLGFLGYDSVLEIKLGDQVQKNMTVLFSDIKDFTRLSENMSPKEAFDFINTFLGVVSPLIREHGGFIDKFIGDAIMALFPGGANDATNAAISMTKKLKMLNKERLVLGLEPIQIGTGLHTGDLMLGTIGEEMRMEGTVISDVVNTASRLEGLTKLFDSRIIISSDVKDEIENANDLHFRYLGKSRVKGKNNVLDVYGIVEGDDDRIMELQLKSSDAFEAGINNFYNKNFTNASVNFNEVLKINPKDKAASIFLKRSAHLMIIGVPENWSGVDEGMSLLENDLS
jgi:two-component system sensor histidine kinase ChiS